MFLPNDRPFYQKIATIAVPIALQNLINFGVSAMDTIMLGMIGEIQLSASSIANQITFIFLILSFGVASGSGVMIAQYWGKGDRVQIKKIMAFMYLVVLSLALGFTVLSFYAPKQLMLVFITDPEVVTEGIVYLRVIAFTYLFSGITNATIGAMRSVGTVHISVIVYSVSLLSNMFLNWVLIFGNLGAPRLGILGAAIATLISRMIETMIILVFLFRFEKKVRVTLPELCHFEPSVIQDFMKYSLPVVFNETLWSTGNAMITMIIGHMGREFVAANSITSVLFQLAGTAIFGMANAASTIIGNTIGEGDYQKAKQRGNAFLIFSTIVGVLMGLLVFVVRKPVVGFYHISQLAQQYALQITTVSAVYVAFQAIAIICMMGVLRGGGDTRFVMVADVIFLWAVAIPLGALTGLRLGWPVSAVYAVLKCEDLFKTIIVFLRIPKGGWIRDVTREM